MTLATLDVTHKAIKICTILHVSAYELAKVVVQYAVAIWDKSVKLGKSLCSSPFFMPAIAHPTSSVLVCFTIH